LKSEGVQFILKNFDKLFSMIELIDQIDFHQLHFVYENILVNSKLIVLIILYIKLILVLYRVEIFSRFLVNTITYIYLFIDVNLDILDLQFRA